MESSPDISVPRKEFLIWAARLLQVGSLSPRRASLYIARRYGKALRYSYVGGYPKSGTTWIAQMVAHYLDRPYVATGYPPYVFLDSLVHHHWRYEPALDHSIQVLRDGRDVLISLYMNVMMNYSERNEKLGSLKNSPWLKWMVGNIGYYATYRKRLQRLYGTHFDPWDTARNLPRFVEEEVRRPFQPAAKVPWSTHVMEWKTRGKQTIFVKYEDALADGRGTMQKALEAFLLQEVSIPDLEYTLQRFSFKRKTGRDRGTEDRKSFSRKGVSGDWRNYFSKESRQIFDHYAGQALIELGYEPDHAWVENC